MAPKSQPSAVKRVPSLGPAAAKISSAAAAPKSAAARPKGKASAPTGTAGKQKAGSPAIAAIVAEPPRPWPPKVQLGPIDDVLPLIADNDDSIDTLMLRAPAADDQEESSGVIGPAEFEYVCACLRNSTNVTHLNASFNAIGDDGAAHLAQLLRTIPTDKNARMKPHLDLMRVSLNSCGIGAVGIVTLAEALLENRCVQTLELMDNNIDDVGGRALLDMLKKNRALKNLVLSLNPISEELQADIDKQLMIR